MRVLKPDGRIDLEHRSYFLGGSPGRSLVVSAAPEGLLSILSPDLSQAHPYRYPAKILAISPHPSDRRLALIGGEGRLGSLFVHDPDAGRPVGIVPPRGREDAPSWINSGIEDCRFDDSGAFLWLAVPLSTREGEIQLIETATWSLAARAVVADPVGWSAWSFHGTGRPGLVILWLAAGQDGQRVYWLRRDGAGFSCTFEPRLINTMPPIFSPDGEHFLVLDEEHNLGKYESNGGERVGSPLNLEDEDDPFAESLAYLNERQVLASTNEGRIFLVDTDRMELEDEVALEGHEPRPIGEYYPTLTHEAGWATDITVFARLGRMIFFTYRRDRGTSSPGWKDTLLWMSASDDSPPRSSSPPAPDRGPPG
jgi:hypothetical protein